MTALFWKLCGGALISGVLVLMLMKQDRDLALILGMAACAMTAAAGLAILEPVLEFLQKLETLGDLHTGVLGILLKITGIGLTGELSSAILTDSGNASLAKGLRMAATALMLSLSLPVLEMLLELMESVMGGL